MTSADNDPNAPVLFFDSGVGGLSILEPARALLPRMPVVYVADRAGYPYGTKSEAEITARVPALLGRLVERYRPRMVVIPCNTASVIALAPIRAALDLPVVGTVPAIKPAAALTRTHVIGVLGTDATVRQPYVDRLSAEFARDCTVLRQGSAALVQLAEDKLRGLPVDPRIVTTEFGNLLEQPGGDRIDTVVLACTHFPLLEEELTLAAPRPIRFVDSADGIARRIAYLNGDMPWPDKAPPGIAVFTRMDPDIEPLKPALARLNLSQINVL